MKLKLPLLLGAVLTCTGCTSSLLRPATTVLAGAAGGVIGGALSNGRPTGIAGGAAAGVILSETAYYAASKSKQRAFDAGYQQALSDEMKSQYWQQQFRHWPASSPTLQLPVPRPERITPDGVRLVPSTEFITLHP